MFCRLNPTTLDQARYNKTLRRSEEIFQIDPCLSKYCTDQISKRYIPENEIQSVSFCHKQACKSHFSTKNVEYIFIVHPCRSLVLEKGRTSLQKNAWWSVKTSSKSKAYWEPLVVRGIYSEIQAQEHDKDVVSLGGERCHRPPKFASQRGLCASLSSILEDFSSTLQT